MNEYYICEHCGVKQRRTTPKEDMEKELKEIFGDVNPETCAIVCDDCWKEMMDVENGQYKAKPKIMNGMFKGLSERVCKT